MPDLHTNYVYAEWEAGDATDVQALRALLSDLREVESELAPLQEQVARLREQISRIAARSTEPIELPGLGRVLITAPSVSHGYDTKRLDGVLVALTRSHPHIAAMIADCQKTTERAGSLRIEKAR